MPLPIDGAPTGYEAWKPRHFCSARSNVTLWHVLLEVRWLQSHAGYDEIGVEIAAIGAVSYGSEMTDQAYQNPAKATSRIDFLYVERAAQALGLIGTIRSLQVNGARHMSAKTVMAIADLNEGDVYNPQDFSRQIGALKSTGFFSEVEIEDDDGNLEITVSENPVIRNVVYEGPHLHAFKEFEIKLSSISKSIISRNKIIVDISVMIEELGKLGIYGVGIIPKLTYLKDGKADLIFEEELRDTFDESSINSEYANYDNVNLQLPESLNEQLSSFLKNQIADSVSGPLSRALRLAKFPEAERDAFIEDTISRIVEHRTVSAPTPDNAIEATAAVALPQPPEAAPIRWKDRDPGETAPDFARRVYGPWLKDGMSKRMLRSLDPTLVTELNKWVREGNEMPDDIKILKVSDENQRLLDAGPEMIREHLGKFTGQEAVRELTRLRSAQQRRS